MIDRAQILQMIPHEGAMCLLDEVIDWDDISVRGLSRRYRDDENPMRRADGVLGMACGIEIAAQAMAVHGRLCSAATGPPVRGYLASLRDVQLNGARLDAIAGDLMIKAARLMGDDQGAAYSFTLDCGGVELLTGRATVMFMAAR